jgi:hypothetical protein
MTATLLAHAGHVTPHGGTKAFIGIVLLLIGAAAALWRTHRPNSPRTAQRDDSPRPGRVPSDTHTHQPRHPSGATHHTDLRQLDHDLQLLRSSS